MLLLLVFTNGLFIGLSLAHAALPWYLALPLRLTVVFGAPYLTAHALDRWLGGFADRQAIPTCMIIAGFAIFMLSGGNHLSNYVWLARGDNVEGVRIADANEHPDASYMRLQDARFRPDLALFHKWYDDEDTYYYHAVPIVDPDWTPGDSILAWAVCSDREYWALARAPETVPMQGFVVTHHRNLRRTLRKHGRSLNPWAVALELSVLPYEAQLVYTWRKVRAMLWIVNGILLALWIFVIVKVGR